MVKKLDSKLIMYIIVEHLIEVSLFEKTKEKSYLKNEYERLIRTCRLYRNTINFNYLLNIVSFPMKHTNTVYTVFCFVSFLSRLRIFKMQ